MLITKLENVLSEWREDNKIDPSKLNTELMRTPLMHSKYLDIYVFFKAKLSAEEKKYNKMKWQKEKYWRGEMSAEELQQYGWSQWQRLKPTAQDLGRMFESDRDLSDIDEKVDYYKTAVAASEFIMKAIQSREFTLKTLFEYQKFTG
jgi:hypothetical protein